LVSLSRVIILNIFNSIIGGGSAQLVFEFIRDVGGVGGFQVGVEDGNG